MYACPGTDHQTFKFFEFHMCGVPETGHQTFKKFEYYVCKVPQIGRQTSKNSEYNVCKVPQTGHQTSKNFEYNLCKVPGVCDPCFSYTTALQHPSKRKFRTKSRPETAGPTDKQVSTGAVSPMHKALNCCGLRFVFGRPRGRNRIYAGGLPIDTYLPDRSDPIPSRHSFYPANPLQGIKSILSLLPSQLYAMCKFLDRLQESGTRCYGNVDTSGSLSLPSVRYVSKPFQRATLKI